MSSTPCAASVQPKWEPHQVSPKLLKKFIWTSALNCWIPRVLCSQKQAMSAMVCSSLLSCRRQVSHSFIDIILRNVVKIEQVSDPISPVTTILKRCNKHVILSIYKIPDFGTPNEFLINIAKKNGKLMKGGIPSILELQTSSVPPLRAHYCSFSPIETLKTQDIYHAAKMVLQDWTGGKIPFYTEPPAVAPDVHVGAAIVTQVYVM